MRFMRYGTKIRHADVLKMRKILDIVRHFSCLAEEFNLLVKYVTFPCFYGEKRKATTILQSFLLHNIASNREQKEVGIRVNET